jgi:hypothetical protein
MSALLEPVQSSPAELVNVFALAADLTLKLRKPLLTFLQDHAEVCSTAYEFSGTFDAAVAFVDQVEKAPFPWRLHDLRISKITAPKTSPSDVLLRFILELPVNGMGYP